MSEISPHDLAAGLTCWSTPVDPRPLGGGLTNTNFVVDDGAEIFVVRIGDDRPMHGILRSQELATCRAAHACGLSPEIVHHEPGALVMRYIDARTLTDADVRDPETLVRIINLVRRCHDEMPRHLRGATLMFWVFQVCRNYLGIASQGSCRIADRLPDLADMNDHLEQAVGPIRPAYCHNDLLPANIIDDGERLWLLDWEYAGWNTPLFDMANLASNAQLGPDEQRWAMQQYLQRDIEPEELATFEVVTCASLLREALWSTVQEQHATLDFDFEAYTDDYLGRFETAYLALSNS